MSRPIPRSLSYAILIDGGFAQRQLGTQNNPATAGHFRALVAELRGHGALRGHRLHRVYYYDAPPLKPPAPGEQTIHMQLSRLPFVSLRLGELRPRAGRREVRGPIPEPVNGEITLKARQLAPALHQKGVDMRLGLDIAALTLKKQADIIVLVTGDADFVPAMKFARREGAQVFLVPLGAGIRDVMREHADLVLSAKTSPA